MTTTRLWRTGGKGNSTLQKLKPIDGFDIDAYRRRLQILREIISGDNQQEFADRLGIDMKRWNNYERGYPVPREIAFMLMQQFPGISIEWVWFGMTGNLSEHYAKRIAALEQAEREQIAAQRQLAKATDRVKEADAKRKR